MDSVKKFQELLKELFQFEASDLDFGIYRILNYKRDQIKKFIEQDLVKRVEEAFSKHKDARLSNIIQKFEEAKKKVIDQLNPNVFTASGELKDEFKNTNVGKDYLAIKAQKDEVEKIDEIKLQVFNDLYSFFSRYYEEGDIVPKYRYSIKNYKYAIPYNGEEVKLYWANSDQYYTKTGYLFRDYTFFSDEVTKVYKIVIRTVSAKEEIGSNKATKERFFILDDETPIEVDNKTLIVKFQYRELDAQEVKKFDIGGGSNASKQEKINLETFDQVIKNLSDVTLKGFLKKDYKNEKSLLLYQLQRFTAKNTKDFFIHKNLKKFLSEQLDYFIKAEVLALETFGQERFLDKHITRAKVVQEIGEVIIDFLSQIEDFQKKLWEKKKFVIQTHYVITTDRVAEELHEEIFKNKEQRQEWKDLGFDLPKNKEELKKQTLPIDTKYFESEFKEKLLESLTEKADLDDILDGILIKSENYQALSLLLNKFKDKVQTIYIDPPFNLDDSNQFLYRTDYKDSNWASLLENRLILAKSLLADRGGIFVRCDYNGNWIIRCLMDMIFQPNNYKNEIIVSKSAKLTELINKYHSGHDSLFFYTKSNLYDFEPATRKRDNPKWRGMHLPGIRWSPIPSEYVSLFSKANLKEKNGKYSTRARIILGKEMLPPEGRHWAIGQKDIFELEKLKKIKLSENGEPETEESDYQKLTDNWTDWVGYSSNWGFATENHEKIIERAIRTSAISDNVLVLDFFLGVGTTTAVAHKLQKKWIGIEMGEHFNRFETEKGPSGVLIRMKEVLAGKGNHEPCGITKEVAWKSGGFFKYHYIEQYEDALDNLELTSNKEAELKFGENYLLKYFLDFETRENASLLNIDLLKKPFEYKLKVNFEEVGEPQQLPVDLVETFNYLLGLKVKKFKVGQLEKNKYLFCLGEKQGKNIVIIWRDYDDNWKEDDFKKDKDFIAKEIEPWAPHIVYVNGQSNLTPQLGKHNVEIRYIEPEFKSLMG